MFTIPLDNKSNVPLYEQIYNYIKNEIKNNNLTSHTKLPSSRNLSAYLNVSRNTVDMAYAQLVSEGYIESMPKKGYFVCQISELANLSRTNQTIYSVNNHSKSTYIYDFSPFIIDMSNFPYNTWRKLSKECFYESNDLFHIGESQGDIALRNAIHKYLHESRGVNCISDQILVGAGTDYLLPLLMQLLPKNSVIAMENPTYQKAYRIFRGLSYHIVPISLDAKGMNVDELSKSPANIAYVTPSHQYPLGTVMPIKRRMELLQWANNSTNRYIIEDDHDSEFRYKGKPIPSLQGIDTSRKVIYMGTFSSAITPALRIGYMVLPIELLQVYQTSFNYYSSTVSRVDQAILTEFMEQGFFERHLNRMRKIYKNKHDTLLNALRLFGDKVKIYGENAGLHLLIELNTDKTEEEILTLTKENGIRLFGLTDYYINKPTHTNPTFILGFANLSEDQIKEGIKKLYDLLVK